MAEGTEHTPSSGRVAPSPLPGCQLVRGKQRQIVPLCLSRPAVRWGSVFCGVLSRVVEEADLTLLPMQKEGSARLSSLRGQTAIVRTLSAPPLPLSLSILA